MKLELNTLKTIICFFFVLIICQESYSQCSFVSGNNPSKLLVKRGHRVFNMNRFKMHLVMYVVHQSSADSLCDVISDSLKYTQDTLIVRVCDKIWNRCSDTLIPKGERWLLMNNGYWLKIPINRLYMLKSKRQPLGAITGALVAASYSAFLGGLIVGLISKDEKTQEAAFGSMIIGDLSTIVSFLTNVYVAKKRFKFNRFVIKNKYWVAF